MLYGFRKVINVPKTLANWNKLERVAERKKINAYKVHSATSLIDKKLNISYSIAAFHKIASNDIENIESADRIIIYMS